MKFEDRTRGPVSTKRLKLEDSTMNMVYDGSALYAYAQWTPTLMNPLYLGLDKLETILNYKFNLKIILIETANHTSFQNELTGNMEHFGVFRR